ncbi:MAG: DNA polymerase/3'-5' exonuclease PolX [Gemmatimonadales bacterium]|nr:DNA polymerase/3'-5' exonuclease PolX [Gemmatimonadales bacterium]NIN49138.1 DNA polymerase/3'-5' exonuclease PolX [Gemmatimonadales bacterium]NIP06602.1 DNA polymerase/3'-5' exonuclease PolX [Gemmatimonadales bacterium]NIR00299.1 DNA polymerase/3'-5' exonuclease PolX [Gemmatimonadales bacterium]NIS64632.1 DNA polymerase/3'-5' exonuclease PolX [Gemmatimonadales bacterium]
MENIDIARMFEDVAALLEIQGANPFRIRAYQNAARTIESHTTPLRKLVTEGAKLTDLPGVGKDIAGYITELVETGELGLFKELTEKVPPSLIELTRLPGVGAKKTKKLWEELGIETIDGLERAANAGEVADLEGFGAKSQQKILEGIAAHRRRQARFRISDADQYVEPLIAYMKEEKAVERIEVAGSYRRRRETVGDIDILAIASEPGQVMQRFTSYPDVSRVELAGDTKGTVVLRSGLQVDLRILPPQSYGAALQYFTGSKEHNVKLRKRAVARDLRVSEYGVFLTGGEEEAAAADPYAGEFVAGWEEGEVYEAVELAWMAPELREDRGEIEAAERGQLPDLITLDDIRGDLQMHSTWSDGKHSIEEMLDGCVERGYEYFAVTDHSKALAMTGGLDAAKLRDQWVEIEEIASRRPEIRVLRSMEVDILADGGLDLEDEMLAQLDVVLVSVHSKFDLPATKQTERILKAIQHPAVHILAHPTGRLINRRDPMEFDLDEVLQCAAECDVIVELNAHPERLDLRDTHLMRARELGLKVVISTDAHRVADLGLMRYGVDQARRAWLGRDDVVNTYPLEKLLTIFDK